MFGRDKQKEWAEGWSQANLPAKMKVGKQPTPLIDKRRLLFEKWLRTRCEEGCALCPKCIKTLEKIIEE